MFEAVPENGTQFLPAGVSRFMGTTTLLMQTKDGQQFPQEVRFDVPAVGLKEAWSKFTAAENAHVAKLIGPQILHG
jgi:hypothetical protein